jgi:hypothetical protein
LGIGRKATTPADDTDQRGISNKRREWTSAVAITDVLSWRTGADRVGPDNASIHLVLAAVDNRHLHFLMHGLSRPSMLSRTPTCDDGSVAKSRVRGSQRDDL